MIFKCKSVFFILFVLVLTSCKSTSEIISFRENTCNFSSAEQTKIWSKAFDEPFRVLSIDNPTDLKILTNVSQKVNFQKDNKDLKHFTNRLYSTVIDSSSLGVGIAAPQVGILKQIIWVQRFDKDGEPFELYFNPKIIQYSKKKQTFREGCLSVPDRMDVLETRSYAILIEYDTIDNTHHIEMVEDFTAVIFQHEIDHLNGIIYIDRIKK